MTAAAPPSSYRAHASVRSRATASLLSAGVLLAVVLALLLIGIAPRRDDREPGAALATFDVSAGERGTASNVAPVPRTDPRPPEPQRARDRREPPPPTTPVPRTEPPPPLPEFLRMTRSEFGATDIGRMARSPGGPAGAQVADAGGGGGETAVGEPGAAPGGATLYPAEWQRRPRPAEYRAYMPKRAVSGWGIIMCRTIDRYHVEDCRELGETPGSGIARMMRQAAWQFLVRPPMVNGRPQTGTWVRIRFDLTVTEVEGATTETHRFPATR